MERGEGRQRRARGPGFLQAVRSGRNGRRVPAGPQERDGFEEGAAVGGDVPIFGKATEALHRGEVDEPRLQDFVRRMRIVAQGPFGVVTDDGRAPEALEEADLDFLRAEADEAVEARGKALDVFARQTHD